MIDEKIIALLRENNDYVSGEDISRALGVSRAGIWKHIEKLRAEGYDILASPHMGYRLIAAPDRLIPLEITWNLKTKIFGRKVYSFKKTDSTNTLAYKMAEDGEVEGAAVFAQAQSKGKGRFGRVWESPAEGIYMSVILRPDIEPLKSANITLMASVAVAEAIREISRLEARIKWPNDVLVNNLKVSGILTEMKAEQDAIDFVILGIGINVNSAKKELPLGATSIKEESGAAASKVALAKRVLELLEENYHKFQKEPGVIINDWRNLCDTPGTRVKIKSHNETLEGQALDVDDNGALIIRLDNGFTRHIFSGDVEQAK